MLAEAIERETGFAVDRRQIDSQPIKTLGVHLGRLRLTIDLVPTFTVVVHREGEPVESAYKAQVVEEEAEAFGELRAALEAEEKAALAAEAAPEAEPGEAEAPEALPSE